MLVVRINECIADTTVVSLFEEWIIQPSRIIFDPELLFVCLTDWTTRCRGILQLWAELPTNKWHKSQLLFSSRQNLIFLRTTKYLPLRMNPQVTTHCTSWTLIVHGLVNDIIRLFVFISFHVDKQCTANFLKELLLPTANYLHLSVVQVLNKTNLKKLFVILALNELINYLSILPYVVFPSMIFTVNE